MRLPEAWRRYLIWGQAQGRSPRSLSPMRSIFRLFMVWSEAQGLTTIEQLTPEHFLAYQEELSWRQTRTGRPITLGTQLNHLSVLRGFGRWLCEQDLLVSDPTRRLRLPRKPRQLPRVVPEVSDMLRLLEAPGGRPSLVVRDRAILECCYSTGLRRGEVVNLDLGDLDLQGGYCWVRQGKGRKDRVVPLGRLAAALIQHYLDGVRPQLLQGREDGALFVSLRGRRLSGRGIYALVKRAAAQAQLSRAITPHTLRHAAATHMLRNGAPIRHLQEFLGHASVETTQVYTQITIPELKAIHAKYHPRERLAECRERSAPRQDEAQRASASVEADARA